MCFLVFLGGQKNFDFFQILICLILIVPATSTTQNFTKKIKKKRLCIKVNKNAQEKLSLGFGVTKIKTDTAGACF